MMTQQRSSIFLLVFLSIVCLGGCDRGSPQSNEQRAEQERPPQEGRQREEQQAREKADAEVKKQEVERAAEKQKMAKFVESAQPALKQFRAMKMRTDNGLSLVEYRQKLGEITDAIAGIGTPPDNRCKSAFDGLKRAMDSYNKELERWPREMQYKQSIERFGTPAANEPGIMRDLSQQSLDSYHKEQSERLRLWAEAQASFDQAAAIIESLQQ